MNEDWKIISRRNIRSITLGEAPKVTDVNEALKLSIHKWDTIRDYLKIGYRVHGSTDSSTCALCMMFNNGNADAVTNCAGCPVKAKTGYSYCRDSPFMEFCKDPTWENAEAELHFLESLRKPKIVIPNTELWLEGFLVATNNSDPETLQISLRWLKEALKKRGIKYMRIQKGLFAEKSFSDVIIEV